MCRFHTKYPERGPYAHDTATWAKHWAEHWNDDEQEMWDCVWEADEQHLSEYIETGEMLPNEFRCDIETIKAEAILWDAKRVTHCEDCQPLLFKFEEDLEEEGYSDEMCHCNTFGHFSYHWRCIPCVLLEEVRSVTLRQKYKVGPGKTCPELGFYYPRVRWFNFVHFLILHLTDKKNADTLLFLRKGAGPPKPEDMQTLQRYYWLVRRPQRNYHASYLCPAWDFAGRPQQRSDTVSAGLSAI